MKSTNKLFALCALVFALFTFNSCDDDDAAPAKNIVEVALADPANFSILVAALQKAELVETLKGKGPFTVFAPTNAAFAAAGITSLDGLTKEALQPILLYHVLGGQKITAEQLATGSTLIERAAVQKMYISKSAAGVSVNGGSKVTTANVEASNGIIHVINKTLIPPSKNIVDIAEADGRFKTLVKLVTDAGLVPALSAASGNFTVFAPTDGAFEELFKTVDPKTLTAAQISNILQYHVVNSVVFSSDLKAGDVTMFNSGKVMIDLANGVGVKGNGSALSKVVVADVFGTNGVIHAIDKVLLP